MKVLAKAHPNKRYEHYTNLAHIYLEARLIDNKVHYYEIRIEPPFTEHPLSEIFVESLFPTACMIKDRPFTADDNRKFYAVLNRRKKSYADEYYKIKREQNDASRTSTVGRTVHRP